MIFQSGDIAACYGRDAASWAVRVATASWRSPRRLRLGPSHVALLFPWRGEMIWGESTTLSAQPCLVRGEAVRGAQAHTPCTRIQEYAAAGGWVDVYRLAPFHRLTLDESRLLTRLMLDEFILRGVSYDLSGALWSGTRTSQWARWFPGAGLEELFCSELVAAVAMRLNRLNHANPARFNPARLLRALVDTGKYAYVGRASAGGGVSADAR